MCLWNSVIDFLGNIILNILMDSRLPSLPVSILLSSTAIFWMALVFNLLINTNLAPWKLIFLVFTTSHSQPDVSPILLCDMYCIFCSVPLIGFLLWCFLCSILADFLKVVVFPTFFTSLSKGKASSSFLCHVALLISSLGVCFVSFSCLCFNFWLHVADHVKTLRSFECTLAYFSKLFLLLFFVPSWEPIY